MRKLILAVVAGATMALAGSASAQTRGTENLSWAERLGIALLSQELGVNPDTVLGTRNQFGVSIYDIAPMFVIGQHTNRGYTDIWQLKSSGLGWGQIAQRLNMHPGTFNKLRKSGRFDNSLFWPSVFRNRFDLTDSQIRNLRNQGYSWDDIAAISHLSFRSGLTTSQVVSRFRTDKDWDRVRTNLKVNDDFREGHWTMTMKRGKSGGGSGKAKVSSGKGNSGKVSSGSGKSSGKGNTKVRSGGSGKDNSGKTKSGGNGKSGGAKAKSGGNSKGKGKSGGGNGKGKGGG